MSFKELDSYVDQFKTGFTSLNRTLAPNLNPGPMDYLRETTAIEKIINECHGRRSKIANDCNQRELLNFIKETNGCSGQNNLLDTWEKELRKARGSARNAESSKSSKSAEFSAEYIKDVSIRDYYYCY